MEELLTEKEVAAMLKLHKRTVAKLRKKGDLVYFQIEKQFRYPISSVEAYLERGRGKEHGPVEP